jgi:hypothetical protein
MPDLLAQNCRLTLSGVYTQNPVNECKGNVTTAILRSYRQLHGLTVNRVAYAFRSSP